MNKFTINTAILIALLFGITTIANAQWTQIGADIDGEVADDMSGGSVSLSSDGSILAIGAYGNDGNGSYAGHVRVYENQSGTWTQIGSDIDGELDHDYSGESVSLSSDGSILAIGAYHNDGNGNSAGHARVYENQSGTWIQIGSDIDGEAEYDRSGYSVSLSSDGSILAIGAYQNDGNGSDAGHVRVYENQSGTWTQIGSDIDGEEAGDKSGRVSLSSDGSVVAIGTHYNDGNDTTDTDRGHVRVYENQLGTWTQIGNDIDGEAEYDMSGISVSLSSDGSVVAIGAQYNNGNDTTITQRGHVRIYENQSGTWTQIGSDIDGEVGDISGHSVSLSSDGSILAIGAYGNGSYAGQVRVYENQSGAWVQIGSDIDGEANNDRSGWSVSLNSDGSVVAIGALYNDGNGTNAGHVRVHGFTTGIIESSSNTKIFVYPNPTTGKISVEAEDIEKIDIYDIQGMKVKSQKANIKSQNCELDLSTQPKGIYIIKVRTSKGVAVEKIVKE